MRSKHQTSSNSIPFENFEINRKISGIDVVVQSKAQQRQVAALVSANAQRELKIESGESSGNQQRESTFQSPDNMHMPMTPRAGDPSQLLLQQIYLAPLSSSRGQRMAEENASRKAQREQDLKKVKGLDKLKEQRQRQRNWLKMVSGSAAAGLGDVSIKSGSSNMDKTGLSFMRARQSALPAAIQLTKSSLDQSIQQMSSTQGKMKVSEGIVVEPSIFLRKSKEELLPLPLNQYVYDAEGVLQNQQATFQYAKKSDSDSQERVPGQAYWINAEGKKERTESLQYALGIEQSRHLSASLQEYSVEQHKLISQVRLQKLNDSPDVSVFKESNENILLMQDSMSQQADSAQNQDLLYTPAGNETGLPLITSESVEAPNFQGSSVESLVHTGSKQNPRPTRILSPRQSMQASVILESEDKLRERAKTLKIKQQSIYTRNHEYARRLVFVIMDKTLSKLATPIFPIWIPLYNQGPKSAAYDSVHTQLFLQECTKYFQSKLDLKHMFLIDGSPLFNLDEIPLDQQYISVSSRPFLRERRMLSFNGMATQSMTGYVPNNSLSIYAINNSQQSLGQITAGGYSASLDTNFNPDHTLQKNRQGSIQYIEDPNSKRANRIEISKEARHYLREREERHLRSSISKEVVALSLKKFGHDLLKDENFFEDLPEGATKQLSQVFKDNTYLFDKAGNKTERIFDQDESITSQTQDAEEKHLKILLNIKKQLGVMQHVKHQHEQATIENFKPEEDFCFTSSKDKALKRLGRNQRRVQSQSQQQTKKQSATHAPFPSSQTLNLTGALSSEKKERLGDLSDQKLSLPSKEVIPEISSRQQTINKSESATQNQNSGANLLLQKLSQQEARARSRRLFDRLEQNVDAIIRESGFSMKHDKASSRNPEDPPKTEDINDLPFPEETYLQQMNSEFVGVIKGYSFQQPANNSMIYQQIGNEQQPSLDTLVEASKDDSQSSVAVSPQAQVKGHVQIRETNNSIQIFDSLLQAEPKPLPFDQQLIIEASINNKLQHNESLFDPTQQFMQESVTSSRIEDQSRSKAESQFAKGEINPPNNNEFLSPFKHNQSVQDPATTDPQGKVPLIPFQKLQDILKKTTPGEAQHHQPGFEGPLPNHIPAPIIGDGAPMSLGQVLMAIKAHQQAQMKSQATISNKSGKPKEEEYEDLVSGVDLDPRLSVELSSSEKKTRRGKLANIIGALLEEKRQREKIWEQIQKKKLEDSTKDLASQMLIKNHHKTLPKQPSAHHRKNISLPAAILKQKLHQDKFEINEDNCRTSTLSPISEGNDENGVKSSAMTTRQGKARFITESMRSSGENQFTLPDINGPASINYEEKFQITNPNEIKGVVSKYRLYKQPERVPEFHRDRVIMSHRQYKKMLHAERHPSKNRSIDVSMQMIMRDKAIQEVDERFHNLVSMNIPKIQMECAFTRKDLYMLFAKFKALSKISKVSFPEIVKDIGVEKSVFIKCLKEEQVDNQEFLEKIFNTIDQLGKGYLNWDEFFRALKLISSRDLKDKIELFFYIVDADGNGRFSFPEIKDICKLSLSKFEDPNYELFREDLADFFAKYIFKIMDKDPEEDEIPASDFKKAIYTGTQEQRDILAMFCCADAQVKENQDKQKVKNVVGMSIAALAKQIKQQRQIMEETSI